jgi:hypothetical protein
MTSKPQPQRLQPIFAKKKSTKIYQKNSVYLNSFEVLLLEESVHFGDHGVGAQGFEKRVEVLRVHQLGSI